MSDTKASFLFQLSYSPWAREGYLSDKLSTVYLSGTDTHYKKQSAHYVEAYRKLMEAHQFNEDDSEAFKNVFREMLFFESLELDLFKTLKQRVSEYASYRRWLVSTDFLLNDDYKYIRNLGIAPILDLVSVQHKRKNALHSLSEATDYTDHQRKLIRKFYSPLSIILDSMNIEERSKCFHHFSAGSRETEAQIEKKGEKVTVAALLECSPHIVAKSLERDKALIANITGIDWSDLYKQSKLSAIRVLALLSHIRKLNGGTLPPLLSKTNSLSKPSFDLIPQAYADRANFITLDWITDKQNVADLATKWINNHNDKYALQIPSSISELLSYLLDGCDNQYRDQIASLYHWYQATTNHYLDMWANEESKKQRAARLIELTQQISRETQALNLPRNKTSESYLFERLSIRLFLKMLRSYEQLYQELAKKAQTQALVPALEPSIVSEISKLSTQPATKRSLEFKSVHKNKTKLFVFRAAALHELLSRSSFVNLSDANKDLAAIATIISSESEQPSVVHFEKPKNANKRGLTNPLDSITAYGKATLFATHSGPTEPAIPRAHEVYWIERFKHALRQQAGKGLPYKEYLSARKSFFSAVITAL